jgi:hypothetical protein
VIPHPLTLLFCWLIGKGLADALGYVLEFAGELCDDAVRYGWAGSGFLDASTLVIGGISVFASGFFIGAAMRLLAEKSWPKAAGWAILLCFLAAVIGSGAPVRLYPAAGLSLLRSPLFLALTPGGCCLGAFLCDRFHEERWLESAQGFMRNWMFWERGGSF